MQVRANGLSFEVVASGSSHAPAALLTMGLGIQLTAWPAALIQAPVDAGYQVIRYDNRDIGLSSYFDESGVPSMALQLFKAKFRLPVSAPYRLHDMADDALGILDVLDIEKAYVIGVSMGGMISQCIAIATPKRIQSLTSIMSSSGALGLLSGKSPVVGAMLAKPRSKQLEDVVEHNMKLFELIGSPGYSQDKFELRDRLVISAERSYHPQGVSRQLLAIMADQKRHLDLARIEPVMLVIHGVQDPLVAIACGLDTANRIANAQFIAIEGMQHDWPPAVTHQLCAHIIPHLRLAA